jgi:effector-binding domain-containing protein
MNEIPEEIVKLAESGEVKLKITKPQEVAFAVHKSSYQKLGEVFGKLAQWVEENGYAIVGHSVTVCHKNSYILPNWWIYRSIEILGHATEYIKYGEIK